jgi:LmbE family N-acetylglucosaminyl deacetylase
MSGVTVVFVHAHPDDEAIFTGGTMALLARAGVPVVLVVATGGELGTIHPRYHGAIDDVGLASVRRVECEAAAGILGVRRVEFLGYHDSGMAGDASNEAPTAFAAAPLEEAAVQLAQVLSDVGAVAVTGYDADGVYRHPDHIQVTNVVRAAAERAGVPTVYGATVDREYLHFVESHIVAEAGLVDDLGLVRSRIGVATVEVAVAVDVSGTIDQKRAAIAAHASQIPESASVLQLPDHHFLEVYGWEWFVRWGPRGPLEELA